MWLEDGYCSICSITVANHQLITVIKFVVKSYTHSYFANRLHLVLHACEILLLENVHALFLEFSKTDPNTTSAPLPSTPVADCYESKSELQYMNAKTLMVAN